MNIQITNLSLNLIEADLRRLFTPFGEIGTVELMRDKHNNRPTGKGIVIMPVQKQAKTAIVSLDGTLLAGKRIIVAEAPSQEMLWD
jgi:RNA recognition motif-containing protein